MAKKSNPFAVEFSKDKLTGKHAEPDGDEAESGDGAKPPAKGKSTKRTSFMEDAAFNKFKTKPKSFGGSKRFAKQ